MEFWQPNSPLNGLAHVKNGRARRESSGDQTGGHRDFKTVRPGGTFVMADIQGGGHVNHIHGITLGSSVQEHFGLWSMYRFHIEDPVRFNTSLKVSIEHGHTNDQGNDYSSVATGTRQESMLTSPSCRRSRTACPAAGRNLASGTNKTWPEQHWT